MKTKQEKILDDIRVLIAELQGDDLKYFLDELICEADDWQIKRDKISFDETHDEEGNPLTADEIKANEEYDQATKFFTTLSDVQKLGVALELHENAQQHGQIEKARKQI